MAKQKFKLTLTNVGLITLIGIISVFIFTSGPSTFTGAATATELIMPFAIDAWGYMGWGDCSTPAQTGSTAAERQPPNLTAHRPVRCSKYHRVLWRRSGLPP